MCTYNNFRMSANSTTFLLSLALLALIIYSAFDISSDLNRINQTMGSKGSATIKSPYKEQQDSCSGYQDKTKSCL